jgi:hypothetical protein
VAKEIQFGNRFLNQIIFGGITNTQFLKQIRSQFPIELYKSSIRRNIAQILYDYVDEYKEAPGDHFYDLFYDFVDSVPEKKRDLYIRFIESLREIEDVNEQYILDRIFEAIRHIRLEEAILDAAKLVKNKRYEDAERIFLEAIKDPKAKSFQYLDYFNTRDDLIIRISEDPFFMKTLIPSMDKIIGGIRKGETVVWLGTPKAGKTFGLINMAHAALMQGLTVIFISLELHRHRISGRMDQTAGFLGGLKKSAQEIMICKKGKWIRKKKSIKTIYDLEEVERVRSGLRRLGGRLIIASAPPNTKNWRDCEMFLDELEVTEGIFPPYVLCIDYLRNMRAVMADQKRKERVSDNCQGIVKMATERQIVAFSAGQGNRKGMSAKILTPDMIADDVDTVGFVDILPTICQTKYEKSVGKARIYLPIVRESASGAVIEVVTDLSRGQFCLSDRILDMDWGAEEKK